MGVQISLTGQVQLTALANVRQGQPATSAAVQRKLPPGSAVAITAIVAGESIQGNPLWFALDAQTFVWSGACGPVSTSTSSATVDPVTVAAPAPDPVPVAARAVGTASSAVPLVIDLYHGDVVTSFDHAFAAGVRGIIHKATTGASGRDDLYADRRRAAKQAGMLWGAYHWGTAAPADQQVENFLTHADPDEDTLVALDYETTNGNQMTLPVAREYLERLHDRLGRRAVLYGGALLKEDLGSRVDPFLGQHRLWLAQYGPRAVVQRSWSTWWLWQYAEEPAHIPGLPGNATGAIDLDRFAGSEAELARQWAG